MHVKRYDGLLIRVAPASFAKHGLTDGQTLTKDEWDKLGVRLAIEWLEFAEQLED